MPNLKAWKSHGKSNKLWKRFWQFAFAVNIPTRIRHWFNWKHWVPAWKTQLEYLFGWLSKSITRLNTQIATSGRSTVTKFEQHVDQMDMSPGRRHFSLRSGDIITIVQATLIKSYISLSGRAKANKSRIL